MRAGICSVQQALTVEAASLVKQAVTLAKRRGHSQVTPLHVASAMLASSNSLFRRACLQSHSHPLQCKALELSFNVALNRLPTSASSPFLGPPSSYPSFSNALVAAFKRAQAHQRRGSIENQQQPILALKIELEELVISILDDPSISRVMREAGFSRTHVKSKVEQAVSLEICSPNPLISKQSNENPHFKPQVGVGANVSQFMPFSPFGSPINRPIDQARNDDVMCVLNSLLNKKRNTIVIGECLAKTESVIRGVMEKFERGNVPGELKYVQFISLPLLSLRNLSKMEVEQKLVELRCLVKSYIGGGVILYLGDLNWVSEFWSNYGDKKRNYYCLVEHIIMEIKRLMHGIGETRKLWLMGIANFRTYIQCQTGHPSLETIWELHPLTIPVGSLSLTLSLDSDSKHQFRSNASADGFTWPPLEAGALDKHLTRYTEGSAKLKGEAQSIQNLESVTSTPTRTSSSLPSWLQKYKDETKRNTTRDQECGNVCDLYKKLSSFGGSSPSTTSISSCKRKTCNLQQTQLSWPVIFESKELPQEHQFWVSEANDDGCESKLNPKPDLLSNPNSSPNSASSSEATDDVEGLKSFKEFNTDNLKTLCTCLEKRVPWQMDIIPVIAETILQCRSGISQNKLNHREGKEETWMVFLGNDFEGKETIARELARLVFGSSGNFVSISLSNSSSPRVGSSDESKNKRAIDEPGTNCLESFGLALNENPHRVFFIENVDQINHSAQKGIKQAIETGKVTLPGGETVPLMDSIVIFSFQSFSSVSRACSPTKRQKMDEGKEDEDEGHTEEKCQNIPLDLNVATETDKGDEDSVADTGILESVDRQFVFKIQNL
ncbi:protein SMAX1-LIKE 3-like [Tripterygium wilfordii]|nr:protein SMAX1-LIKE 3-like [Tripterygium wilfordii]